MPHPILSGSARDAEAKAAASAAAEAASKLRRGVRVAERSRDVVVVQAEAAALVEQDGVLGVRLLGRA